MIALNIEDFFAEDFLVEDFSTIDFIELNKKLFRKDLFEEIIIFYEEVNNILSNKLKVLLLV